MTDASEKFLRKLTAKELNKIKQVTAAILAGSTIGMDVKPLTGLKDAYRIRVGRIRIIFIQQGSKVTIIRITNRDGKTYKGL